MLLSEESDLPATKKESPSELPRQRGDARWLVRCVMTNLFSDLPRDSSMEVIDAIIARDAVRIERIVSMGHASPPGFWYDQQTNEWVLVLRGVARLAFDDGETIDLKPGDFVNIPAHRRHRVEWTTPNESTIWLAVHYR